MPELNQYRSTLADRQGANIGLLLRAWSYGLLVGVITVFALFLRVGFHWWVIPLAAAAGLAGAGGGWVIARGTGVTWNRFMTGGATTPYVEQYSYQETLVMRGNIRDALASFEAVIAEHPTAMLAHTKAAELYVKDGNFKRAAELFRAAQGIPELTAGDDAYVTNRLVDLLVGPLEDPGRALVELRHLIHRQPNSVAAKHARDYLLTLKAQQNTELP
jgi:tetratricopeptide (TPR) repeat protein